MTASWPGAGRQRVRGLDAIRFVLAIWVMIGHLGRLPYAASIPSGPGMILVRGIYNNVISGPAAVIVFFVISGFCIHFPYRDAERVVLLPYFARRHIRILVPVGVALGLAQLQGLRIFEFNHSILWSLLCEEIYYTVYPVLLKLRSRWGWPVLIGASFVAALAVAATDPGAGDYPSFGWRLNWILGLPCWLLGCDLAQRWKADSCAPDVRALEIWAWRFGILGLSVGCSALRFHTSLTYPWTLNFFALAVVVWLQREIIRGVRHAPMSVLEWAGAFSYSIYLVHVHGQNLVLRLTSVSPSELPGWILVNLAVLGLCYVFYRAVERPSHHLARRVYAALMGRIPSPQV
jgi:peptidoglycan/LPS O-acetylase OafA/YrhL